MTDEPLSGPDEDSALAAEHALRLLDGPMRSKAEARMRDDKAFAQQVERWQERIAPLFDAVAPVQPPASSWASLATKLGGEEPANDNIATLQHRIRVWRGLTAGAAAIAAVCVAALVLRGPMMAPMPVPVAPAAAPASTPITVAALRGETGPAAVVAAYDRDAGSLVITPAAMAVPSDKSAELWLIPAGGKPQSLGILDPTKPTRIAVPSGVGAAGAALAVSIEPTGGSPGAGPTGPVIASGALAVA